MLLTPNIMYTIQKIRHNQLQSADNDESENEEYENKEVPSPIKSDEARINAIGVTSCNSSVLRIGEDSVFINLRH